MTVIDRALLNHGFPGSTWGNLGLWSKAQDYPAACEALAARLAKGADLQPGCTVLDVGFGFGDQMLLWKQRYGVGRITGMEIDAVGLAEARRKLARFKDVSLHLSNGQFPPSKERYDRVLALDCAYHFAPRSAFLEHALQTLNPGGVLALTDIVVADGATAAQSARLARICGIPPENLLTQTAYAQALSDLGYSAVRLERLDDEVLSGFTRFTTRLLRRNPLSALRPGGLKILATAAIIRWLQHRPRMHYVLVTAQRPT